MLRAPEHVLQLAMRGIEDGKGRKHRFDLSGEAFTVSKRHHEDRNLNGRIDRKLTLMPSARLWIDTKFAIPLIPSWISRRPPWRRR